MKNVSPPEVIKISYEKDSKASEDVNRNLSDNPRKQTDSVKLWFSGPVNDQPKWSYLRYDKKASMTKMFHFELHWFVCDAWLMEDFVNYLYRRCSSFGLRIVQVPESFYTPNLRIHPFRAQLYVPILTNEKLKSIVSLYPTRSPVTVMENLFIRSESEKWIRDDPQYTDWKTIDAPAVLPVEHGKSQLSDMLSDLGHKPTGNSLTLQSTSSRRSLPDIKLSAVRRNTSNHQEQNVMKSYYGKIGIVTTTSAKSTPSRQYMHRNGFAALRVGTEGVVWLLNTSAKVNDINTPIEEKRTIALSAYKQFSERCMITSLCVEITIEIIEEAMTLAKAIEERSLI
jgi:hypothetical protein